MNSELAQSTELEVRIGVDLVGKAGQSPHARHSGKRLPSDVKAFRLTMYGTGQTRRRNPDRCPVPADADASVRALPRLAGTGVVSAEGRLPYAVYSTSILSSRLTIRRSTAEVHA